MTKSEYFEKNGISFAKAMEIFNAQKNKKGGTKSFDKFLASEHIELKFKAGDLIVLDCSKKFPHDVGWDHNVVFTVETASDHDACYELKALTPSSKSHVGQTFFATRNFVEDNCTLY